MDYPVYFDFVYKLFNSNLLYFKSPTNPIFTIDFYIPT